MKDIVLDTNVIVSDPTLLAQRHENVRLLAPASVLRQIENLSAVRSTRLAELIRRAAAAGNVTIVRVTNPQIAIALGRRDLDPVDFDILAVSLENRGKNPNTILATNDLELQVAAESQGLQVVGLQGTRDILRDAAAADDAILEEAKAVSRRWRRHGFINLAVGLVCAVLAVLLNVYWDHVFSWVASFAGFIALAIAGVVLLWIRSRWRWGYGIAEYAVGLLITWNGTHSVLSLDHIGAFEFVELSGGLYVMVRGLDNFGRGLRGYPLGSKWSSVFPD
jgi:hypothetical protein